MWPPSIPCSTAWRSEAGSWGAGSRRPANDGDASIASRQPDVRRWPISARSGASSSPRSTVFPEFVMHDWRADVRARLASAQLHPQDEAEIVEEIAQHLEAQFAELAPTIGAPAAR